jgi:hypothetical protein
MIAVWVLLLSAIAAPVSFGLSIATIVTMRRGLLMSNQLTACQYFRSAGQPRPSTRENWECLVSCWRFRYHPRAPIIEALQADSEGPFDSRTLEHFLRHGTAVEAFAVRLSHLFEQKSIFHCGVAAFQSPYPH